MSLILDNISIIVVEPLVPANIGSIARACQNLGLKNIILINPCEYLVEDAFRLAKHAKPLLFGMQHRESLEACLRDHHILIGTSRRRRQKQVPFYTPKEIISKMTPYSQDHKIGIVFGRENHGLTNEELEMCNFQLSIPAHQENTVFNLSQAVLLVAYECFNASDEDKDPYIRPQATKHDEALVVSAFENMVLQLDFDKEKGLKNFSEIFKRIISRAVLEKRDIRFFYKLFDLIQSKF